jgi:hypothetical protein
MNIPFTQVVYEEGVWTYTWASGLGLVRVVLWGELLATTEDNAYTYTAALYLSNTDAPPIEVVFDGGLAISERNACYLVLQWYRVDCDQYEVEFKVGENWRNAGSILDDSLITLYTHITPLLEDQVIAEWRVTAVDGNKRESIPLDYSYKIVRPPNPPVWDDASCIGGTLTVE